MSHAPIAASSLSPPVATDDALYIPFYDHIPATKPASIRADNSAFTVDNEGLSVVINDSRYGRLHAMMRHWNDRRWHDLEL
jgi:hypothetical protein